MKKPPVDWLEFWIRFGCAVVFFGLLFAIAMVRFLDQTGLVAGVAIWLVATLAAGTYAARVGDAAWHELIETLRWW